MKLMSKPFFCSQPFGAFQPFVKEDKVSIHVRQPNAQKNTAVFNRLYDAGFNPGQNKALRDAYEDVSAAELYFASKARVDSASHNNSEGRLSKSPMRVGNRSSKNPSLDHSAGKQKPEILLGPRINKNLIQKGQTPKQSIPKAYQGTDPQNQSYVVRERVRHVQDVGKKFTWESLEKMNINELKGITNINFDPAALIGKEEDEDKLYMQEFTNISESNKNLMKQVREKQNFEHYGELKNNRTIQSGALKPSKGYGR
jgi:hypothetical protein